MRKTRGCESTLALALDLVLERLLVAILLSFLQRHIVSMTSASFVSGFPRRSRKVASIRSDD